MGRGKFFNELTNNEDKDCFIYGRLINSFLERVLYVYQHVTSYPVTSFFSLCRAKESSEKRTMAIYQASVAYV